MFRKMRREDRELSREESFEILENAKRGVLAVQGEEGYPYTVPISPKFYNGKVYFHGAKEGHKIDSLKACDKVTLCVMDDGVLSDDGWSMMVKSTVVFGRVKLVDDVKLATEVIRSLATEYYPNAEMIEESIQSGIDKVQLLELTIEHITGKFVLEK